MRLITLRIVAVAFLISSLTPQAALGCSCADPPINKRYADSDVLILVTIGPAEIDHARDGVEVRRWSFDLIRKYKGEPAFGKLWSSGNLASCGVHLIEGAKYLVSPEDDGRVSLCNTWGIGSDPSAVAEINVLNAFKSGKIPELVEPWSYTETPEVCRLTHQFTKGAAADLVFDYRFKDPRGPDQEQDRPYRRGFVLLRGFANHVREGSGTLVVGASKWGTRSEFPYEVLDEKDAGQVLSALSQGRSISFEWALDQLSSYQRRLYPDYPQASASTSYLFLGDALSRFNKCVERGTVQDQ